MSKLNYKETKGLVMRWLARSAPTFARLGLLSVSGGGFLCQRKSKGYTDMMKRIDLKFYETANLLAVGTLPLPPFSGEVDSLLGDISNNRKIFSR